MAQQLPLFQPDSDWVPPTSFPDLRGHGPMAVDTETRDPELDKHGPGWCRRDGGEVVGVSVACDGFKGYYPIGHAYGGNLDRRAVLRWLKDQVSDERQVKVFHNAVYDVGWLRREGVPVLGPKHDTMFGAALLDENRKSYSLDNLGKDWLGQGKSEDLLYDAGLAWGFGKRVKQNLWKLPACFVGPYGEDDAQRTLQLYQHELLRLEADGLMPTFELETSLIDLFVEMRWRGVRVDTAKAERLSETFRRERDEVLAELKRVTGARVDVWSAQSLAVVYEMMGIGFPRTEQGNPTFTAPWFESQEDALSRLVVRARKLDRADSTFASGMILDHTFDGRIHCQFHPLKTDEYGTVSYRLSSSDPNLQQVPARDPYIGPLIRSVFIPEDGETWVKDDYSQQEPRLTVHYSSLLGLRGAEEAVAYYRDDPNADYHTFVRDIVRRFIPDFQRKPAKTINLGRAYGMGKDKLCKDLGLSLEDGTKVLTTYDEALPFVKLLTDECGNRAADKGFIKSLAGHHCRFNMWEPRDWDLSKAVRAEDSPEKALAVVQHAIEQARLDRASGLDVEVPRAGVRRAFTYRAMNRLIQSSAAGQTKIAMRNMWEYTEGGEHVLCPLLQVHDELDFSLGSRRLVKMSQQIMEHAVQLQVPSRCDPSVGPNWGETTEDESKWQIGE